MFFLFALSIAGDARADDKYFDGGVASTVFAFDFDSGTGGAQTCGQSGCHDEPGGGCLGGSSTNWSNYSCAYTYRSSIVTRLTNASDMPLGGPYTQNANMLSRLSTWSGAGYPKTTPATPSTLSANGISKTAATLRGTFNTNTLNGGQYRFQWGVSPSTGTNTSATTLNTISNMTGTFALSGLDCGTTYRYRAQARNGGNTTYTSAGGTQNFTTSACSLPVINFSGAGSSSGNRITVSKSLSFNQSSLTISGSDADTSITWSVGTPTCAVGPCGSTVLNNASTGAFTYNAPASAKNTQFTVTVTDSDPATGGGPNMATVTVYVTVADNAPQFTDSPGGSVITVDSFAVAENNGGSPGQAFAMYAQDADGDTISWSVFSGPSNGSLGSFASATGTTNSITYTPNVDFDTSDSFTIRVTDGVTNVDLVVTANITPDPDNPVAVNDGPITFDIGVPVAISVLANDFDVDTGDAILVDPTSITGVSAGSSATAIGGNTQIQYTSSMTQFTNDTFRYGVIDDSPGTLTSGLATVSLSPRDSDGDGVINYLDNCAATPNPGQEDNDNDSGSYVNNNNLADPVQDVTTPGRIVNTAPGSSPGGDACDVDDDNDGIHDLYEQTNSLDPFTDDAAADNDGDGISNYDEVVNGTNPNLADQIRDATGYLTPYILTPPDPKSIHLLATAVNPIFEVTPSVSSAPKGPYRPGVNDIRWVPSNSTEARLDLNDAANLVQTPPVQTLRFRPLLSFGPNQRAEVGSTVNVNLYLNGEAPSYPVTVGYTISGTATTGVDYSTPMPTTGNVTFADTTPQTISFNLTGASDGETIVFTLDGSSTTNAALGVRNSHRVTVFSGNVAPAVSLDFSQGGNVLATTYAADGAITIDAIVNDLNAADTHSYDWSGSDNALVPPGNVASWMPTIPGPGNYRVEVLVTDNGIPARSTRVSRVLSVVAGNAPALGGGDSDGDGVADNDPTEGHGDDDGDGIPNYLDALDGTLGGSNLIPDQTVDMSNSHLLETSAGLALVRGSTAQSSGRFGTLLTDFDVKQFGSAAGGRPLNADDDFDHATGIYDFEIRGLVPGSTVRIIIPLQTGIPKNAVYRKFVEGKGWSDFVIDDDNKIASAVGAIGACPEPGSGLYRNGLNYLDNCIQLTIKDGGPNDADGKANGVIVDPGTTGIQLSDPETEEVEDGGSRMSPILIALLALLSLLAVGRRRREAS